MFTIKKFALTGLGENIITVNNSYGVMSAEVIDGVPYVWLFVDLATPLRPAYFYVYQENEEVETTQYMNMLMLDVEGVSTRVFVLHKYVYWQDPNDPNPMGLTSDTLESKVVGETTNIVIE